MRLHDTPDHIFLIKTFRSKGTYRAIKGWIKGSVGTITSRYLSCDNLDVITYDPYVWGKGGTPLGRVLTYQANPNICADQYELNLSKLNSLLMECEFERDAIRVFEDYFEKFYETH